MRNKNAILRTNANGEFFRDGMLCQFSFKNFKSYKEATTFDFQTTSIPEFSDVTHWCLTPLNFYYFDKINPWQKAPEM